MLAGQSSPDGHPIAGSGTQQQPYPRALPTVPEYAQQGQALQRWIESEGLLNVTSMAFVVSAHLFPLLRNPHRHFHLLPVVEELCGMMILGRDGSNPACASEGLKTKWSHLMGQLATSLLSNLAIARSESAAIVQVGGTKGAQLR